MPCYVMGVGYTCCFSLRVGVHFSCPAVLPASKPRYVMGVGYPLDIVVCSALGADMYDSVFPTRTARFGVALVPEGSLKLKNARFSNDFRPLDEGCSCSTCRNYTRAYLHNVVCNKNIPSAAILVTYHNIAYMQVRPRCLILNLNLNVQVLHSTAYMQGRWLVDFCIARRLTGNRCFRN